MVPRSTLFTNLQANVPRLRCLPSRLLLAEYRSIEMKSPCRRNDATLNEESSSQTRWSFVRIMLLRLSRICRIDSIKISFPLCQRSMYIPPTLEYSFVEETARSGTTNQQNERPASRRTTLKIRSCSLTTDRR
ncbi:hypothetical protein K0M31_005587 [Melipona bicolor]|uniref:Uncharacterized protein n=1 Tax=Melipona bicolor TaxID=60889 RepID=A0AA40FUG2_9HYME|nr:hypothetical protein K0M31_005587 [Melipona bicolor]